MTPRNLYALALIAAVVLPTVSLSQPAVTVDSTQPDVIPGMVFQSVRFVRTGEPRYIANFVSLTKPGATMSLSHAHKATLKYWCIHQCVTYGWYADSMNRIESEFAKEVP